MRTRVKICGITRPEDAEEAARLGADAIGLVFYPKSPRAVTPGQAREIIAALPPFVTSVGLFVDAPPETVRATLEIAPLALLQFHGQEAPDYCRCFGRPYLKALRMRNGIDLYGAERAYADAAGLLLDSYRPGLPGGTGAVFDWSQIPQDLRLPLVLAGGLAAENITAAIERVHPYAVDVSGGVEQAKGIKDSARLAAFFEGVRRAGTE